jgi:hypothetical protein
MSFDCVSHFRFSLVGCALYLLYVVVVVEELAFAETLNPIGVIVFYPLFADEVLDVI